MNEREKIIYRNLVVLSNGRKSLTDWEREFHNSVLALPRELYTGAQFNKLQEIADRLRRAEV